jgi:hypothetical protein
MHTTVSDPRHTFRSAVAALEPGPLRDVLTAVAYARDEAARTGAATASDDRWRAVVTAAERAVDTAAERAVDTAAERAVRVAPPTPLRLVA